MAPLVSVVMPAFQAERHVGAALRSALAQDWPALEVIAVDDGSTDGTGAILSDFTAGGHRPVQVLRQPNRGAAVARDAGIAAAKGEFILLADADDRCDPGLVSALVRALEAVDADLAFARCRYVDGTGRVMAVQAVQPERPRPVDLLRGIMVNTPLVRRRAILTAGGHNARLDGSIDLDLFVRLAMRREGALVSVPEILSDYRRDEGQITSDWRRMQRTWERVRGKAVAAGLSLSRADRSQMRGHHCAYWATLAYNAGDYPAARRLIAEAALRAPGHVARDELARIRAAACLASLLPAALHDRIRARFNRDRVAVR